MSLNTKQNAIDSVGCSKRLLPDNDRIDIVESKRPRIMDDGKTDESDEDDYTFEPKSPDYPPTIMPPQEQLRLYNTTQMEYTSIDTLKDVTSSLSTDFTHVRQRAQNYGYDFKVLDYFDVEPNYDCETLQQQVQPMLCPVLNGTSIYTNNDKNKNVLTDNTNDVYEDDDVFYNTNNYGTTVTIGNDDGGGVNDDGDEDHINDTIIDGELKMKNLNIVDTDCDDDDDEDNDNYNNHDKISKDTNKQFKFTKTKRNYISMYLNINNIPVLCSTCYGLNCICNE